MADDKVRLITSVNGEAVDYEALFKREGDQSKRSEKFAAKTAIGAFRNPKRFYWFEWVFLAVATFSMLAVIGLSIERFDHFATAFADIRLNVSNRTIACMDSSDWFVEFAPCNKWVCMSDFIFAVALLVNLGFCAFYCYDGLLRERPFEILAYVVAVIVIIVYTLGNSVFQFTRGSREGGEFILKVVRLVLVLLIGPLNICLALMSWWKMGFLVFNTIGANKTLIWAYRCRSFLLTLQWFSLQVMVNIFVLAWSRDGQMLSLAEKVIVPLLTFYMFLLIVLGNVAVLWELHVVSYIWYAVVLPFVAYCLYKLIEVSLHWTDYAETYYVCNKGQNDPVVSTFKFVGAALLIACVVGVLITVLLIVFMAITQKHFGEGLKEKSECLLCMTHVLSLSLSPPSFTISRIVPPPFSKKVKN